MKWTTDDDPHRDAYDDRPRTAAPGLHDQSYQELRAAVLGEQPAPWPCQHCGVRWSL